MLDEIEMLCPRGDYNAVTRTKRIAVVMIGMIVMAATVILRVESLAVTALGLSIANENNIAGLETASELVQRKVEELEKRLD